MIVSQSPQLLGIGVDEDTAAVISRHEDGRRRLERLSVVGRGSVTILDGSHMVTNAHEAKERRPILASGVVLHVLPDGARVRPDHARAGALRAGDRPRRGRRTGAGQP